MEKLRIGVIGVGGMGYAHCKSSASLEETALVAVCDIVPEVAEKRAQEFSVPFYTDYRQLIDSGLAEAVIVATPHWFHPEIAVYAMQKGLHVISEKPIAVTASGADAMVKTARKKKRVFAVMHQRRTEPVLRKAFEIVKSGVLGEIRRTLCIDPWFRAQSYYDSGTWRATWAGEGGGVLINQAPHGIDIFLKLGGMPSLVQAKTRTRLHRIEVEDEVSALLEYPNGAWGHYYTTTCEPSDVASSTYEISGDKGKLILRGSQEIKLITFSPPIPEYTHAAKEVWAKFDVADQPVELPADVAVGHSAIIANFARAIRLGEPLIAPGEENRAVVEFIDAVIMSGRTGKPVKLPLSRRRYDRLMEGLKASSKPKEGVNVQRVTDPKISA